MGEALEKISVLAALRSMERADVAVLVLDGTEPGVDQDARLAGLVAERARALLVVVNKWDLVEKDPRTEKRTREELKWTLKFVAYAPIVFVSALTGSKVDKVLDLAAGLQDSFRVRVPTPALNKLLAKLVDAHPAPIVDGRPLRLYYIAQVGTAPPAFAITTNRPEKVPEAYKRYVCEPAPRGVRTARPPPAVLPGEAGKGQAGRPQAPSRPSLTSNHPDLYSARPFRAPSKKDTRTPRGTGSDESTGAPRAGRVPAGGGRGRELDRAAKDRRRRRRSSRCSACSSW